MSMNQPVPLRSGSARSVSQLSSKNPAVFDAKPHDEHAALNRSQTRSMNRGDSSVETFAASGPDYVRNSHSSPVDQDRHHDTLRKAGYKKVAYGSSLKPGEFYSERGDQHVHGYTLHRTHTSGDAKLSVSAGAAMDPAVKKVKMFSDTPDGVHKESHQSLSNSGYKYSHKTESGEHVYAHPEYGWARVGSRGITYQAGKRV